MECRGKPDTAGNIARSVSRFPSFPRNISYIAESLTRPSYTVVVYSYMICLLCIVTLFVYIIQLNDSFIVFSNIICLQCTVT